jgi:hypothetical protein
MRACRSTLTPTLSRKRERERTVLASPLPLAGEGGALDRAQRVRATVPMTEPQ